MGGQGSKVSEEDEHAIVPTSPSFGQANVLSQTTPPTSHVPLDVIIRKRKREIQSMVLDDVKRAFKTRRTKATDLADDHGIECKAVESAKEREMFQRFHILLRQKDAFDTYIIRRQTSMTRDQYARRYKRHRVRSFNQVQIH